MPDANRPDPTSDHYADDHVGENPVGWPRATVAERPKMWGADEIVENIEDCRGCSHDHGLCNHHRGQIEGYDKAIGDMNRSFDVREVERDD